jgi:hypothetical protein
MGGPRRYLKRRLTMHLRLQGGSQYLYDVLDPLRSDAVIGRLSVTIDKRKKGGWVETKTFTLDGVDREFASAREFYDAYEQKLKGQIDATAS